MLIQLDGRKFGMRLRDALKLERKGGRRSPRRVTHSNPAVLPGSPRPAGTGWCQPGSVSENSA